FLRNKRTSSARFLAPPFQITTTSLGCDLGWETKISGMKPLDKERNLFCLPGQERFSYCCFHTMPKYAIIKNRGFIIIDKPEFERQQEKSRVFSLFLR
ncbi:MAG: hypothetical protein ACI3VE_06260, partial [Oscillospiraceae bacterium]